jgi:hypothetical protein
VVVAIAGAHGKIALRLAGLLVGRPGRLTDDDGTGKVRIETTPFRGEVSRDDVAAVLAGLLHDARADHRILYVNRGEEPVEVALERILAIPAGQA